MDNLANRTEALQQQRAKALWVLFVRAFNSLRFYPEGNPTRRDALQSFHTDLITFLQEYGPLAFEIEKKEICHLGEVICSDSGRGSEFLLSLYWEGLHWLEFQPGIEPEEIQTLLELLDRYSTMAAVPDNDADLLAILADADLAHIGFQDELDMDSLLQQDENDAKLAQFKNMSIVEVWQVLLASGEEPQGEEIDFASMELQPSERLALQEAVEEEPDSISEISKVLVYLLDHKEEDELFLHILGLFREQMFHALVSGKLNTAARTLVSVLKVSRQCPDPHWAGVEFDRFLKSVSQKEFLEPLTSAWGEIVKSRPEQAIRFLALLHPQAIQVLVPVAAAGLGAGRAAMVEAVSALASRDLAWMEPFLSGGDESVLLVMIEILGRITAIPEAAAMLARLAQHRSERVLTCAFEQLRKAGAWLPRELFGLIDHENPVIRKLLLEYLGSRKCEKAEWLLINYVESGKHLSGDREFTFSVLESLGACGVARGRLLLREKLLGGKAVSKFFCSVERAAAASGLAAMQTEEAEAVLGEAAGSRFRGIRLAVSQRHRNSP